MKIVQLLVSLSCLLCLASCSEDFTESKIDDYVADKIQPDQVYDINASPKYSREDDLLQVVSYKQGDTLVMLSVEETTNDHYFYRSIFFKEGDPIYIDDYREENLEADGEGVFTERKVYLANGGFKVGYERKSDYSLNLSDLPYEQVNIDLEEYELNNYLDAVLQENAFDMKFGEFIEIPGQTYLILENAESKYNTAYLILKSDLFLDNLYSKQDLYKGRSVTIYPQFRTIDNVDRMVYNGGELKEKD